MPRAPPGLDGALSVKVEPAREMSVEEGKLSYAVKVLIPTPLRQFTGKQASIGM